MERLAHQINIVIYASMCIAVATLSSNKYFYNYNNISKAGGATAESRVQRPDSIATHQMLTTTSPIN